MTLQDDVPAVHRSAGLVDGGRQNFSSVDQFDERHAPMQRRHHLNVEFAPIGQLLGRTF